MTGTGPWAGGRALVSGNAFRAARGTPVMRPALTSDRGLSHSCINPQASHTLTLSVCGGGSIVRAWATWVMLHGGEVGVLHSK
jgi:hypothetical protein